jgi:serine/threonine protein kinase
MPIKSIYLLYLPKKFPSNNEQCIQHKTFRYHATTQLTTKSDVYSFGVVLLELVTGRPVILHDPEPTSIIDWVRQRLAQGNIEEVTDTRMHGDYDVNSVWKASEIALKCTVQVSAQRPTMTEVVAQLQECLQLEEGHTGGDATRNFYTGTSRDPNSGYNTYAVDGQSMDMSQSSTTFEMEQNLRRATRMNDTSGPVAR